MSVFGSRNTSWVLVRAGESATSHQPQELIWGVTRPPTLKVTAEGSNVDPWGNVRLAFVATGKINRADFGLTCNQALETGGVVVGHEVKLTLDVQLFRPRA